MRIIIPIIMAFAVNVSLAAPITEAEKIIPTPQEVAYAETFLTLFDGKGFQACILIGKNSTRSDMDAAFSLQSQVSRLCGNSMPVLREDQDYSSYSVILSIGDVTASGVNADLISSNQMSVPENGEGYIIKKAVKGGKTFVVAAGRETIGSFYAAASLGQMINQSGSEVTLREIEVRDWPDISMRTIKNMFTTEGYFSDEDDLDWMALLPKLKINNWGLCYTKTLPNWRNPSQQYLDNIKALAHYERDRGTIHLMHLLNPGYTGGLPKDETEKVQLLNLFKNSLDAGGGAIMMAFDDQGSEDPGSHRDLVNYLYKGTNTKKGFQMVTCPQAYSFTAAHPNVAPYLNTFTNGLDSAVDIIWAGEDVFAETLTPAMVDKWSSYVTPKGSRRPFYWDNDPILMKRRFAEGWVPDSYFFKDKSVFLSGRDLASNKEIWSQMPKFISKGVIENIFREATQFKIYAITYADWAWNPDAYKNDDNTFNRAKRYWDNSLSNPAFMKKATASSSTPEYGPELAVDGLNNNHQDQKNAWASAIGQPTVNAWWQVDLGMRQYMSGITVRFREYPVGKAYLVPKSITVQISNDSIAWATKVIKSKNLPTEGAAYSSQFFTYAFEGEARYVKLLFEEGAQVATNTLIELTEVEVLTERPLTSVVSAVRPRPGNMDLAWSGYNVGLPGESGMLRYSLPVGGRVSVDYYDFQGGHIASMVNDHQAPGVYTLRIPLSLWARGLYLQVFRAGNFVSKQKFSVVR